VLVYLRIQSYRKGEKIEKLSPYRVKRKVGVIGYELYHIGKIIMIKWKKFPIEDATWENEQVLQQTYL
jgi:hypothetical protein